MAVDGDLWTAKRLLAYLNDDDTKGWYRFA